MSRSRILLAGASWTYGAQLITVLAQFAYAAFTSRIVSPNGFGAYGVALTVSAFVTLLANGGLSQTVGRIIQLDALVLRALTLYGVILGLSGAAFLYLTAGFWAAFWNTPKATSPIEWLSISALLGPCLGLASGLMRRMGKFLQLAAVTVVANIVGMIIGAAAVATWSTPSTLLVSLLVSQVIIVAACFAMTGPLLRGFSGLRHARESLGFSWKLTLSIALSYVIGNTGSWTAVNVFGASVLGQWNRADVVTFVPFQQIQAAMVQVIYPEFRHDIVNPTRAHEAWPDLLALVAWVTVPAGAVGAVVIPHLVPIFFGPGWGLAAVLTVPLALIGGLQSVVAMLQSAVEALAKFRWIWGTQLVLLATSVVAALLAYFTHELAPIFWGIGLGLAMTHAIHVILCMSSGYLSPRKLFRNYMEVAMGALIAATVAFAGVTVIALNNHLPWLWVPYVIAVTAVLVVAWRKRSALPPIRIARAYGLLK